jgi:hypothetical protein
MCLWASAILPRAAGDSAILPPKDAAVAGRRKDVHLQELLLPMAAIKTRMAAIKTRVQLAVKSKNIQGSNMMPEALAVFYWVGIRIMISRQMILT